MSFFLLMEPAPFCFPNKIYLDCLHTSERKYAKERQSVLSTRKIKYFFGGETALAAARIFAGGADGAKDKQMLLRCEPKVER